MASDVKVTKNINELKRRLIKIQAYYDLGGLLKQKTDQVSVAKYYRLSDFFYKWVHSRGGDNIHMSLSNDGKFHRAGFKEQAETIGRYVDYKTKTVLELGAGKAVNTKHLAKKFPNINFTALDLPNRNFLKNKVPRNVSLVEGSYNNLSVFKPNSFDVVFAVETISHATSKEKVFKQVSRILKPNGFFIIFDIYEPLPHSNMTNFQQYISSVTLAGMSVTQKDHFIGDIQKYLNRNDFVEINITDLTKQIQPNLRKLARVSRFYFDHPKIASYLRKNISDTVTLNSISGYLMELTFDGKTIHQYNRIVARRAAPCS